MSTTSNDSITVAVDPEIIDLAESFLRNRRAQIQDWRDAIAAGNQQVLRRLGHELKGTAGAFGFYGLSELGVELEEMLMNDDEAAARDRVERMIDYLERVAIAPR